MLNEDDIKLQEQKYLDDQKRFNETGDLDILWGPMYKYITETAKSCAKKIVPGNGWINDEGLDNLVSFCSLQIIGRYIKGLKKGIPYSKDYPITMVYLTVRSYAWLGVGTLNKKQSKAKIIYDIPVEVDFLKDIKDVDDLED